METTWAFLVFSAFHYKFYFSSFWVDEKGESVIGFQAVGLTVALDEYGECRDAILSLVNKYINKYI